MRYLIVLLLGFASASLSWAGDLHIVRIWPGYRTQDSFVRISEYFTGKENPGRQVHLRTHSDQRAGFYFLTRLANDGAATPVRVQLDVISPRAPRPVSYTFSAEVPHGQKVYLLGLTGPDWPKPDEHPVAWKLSVLSADGKELAAEQSFLWSKPDRK